MNTAIIFDETAARPRPLDVVTVAPLIVHAPTFRRIGTPRPGIAPIGNSLYNNHLYVSNDPSETCTLDVLLKIRDNTRMYVYLISNYQHVSFSYLESSSSLQGDKRLTRMGDLLN